MAALGNDSTTTAFRIAPDRLAAQRAAFNRRAEIVWFGLEGHFEPPGDALVRFARLDTGMLGGGGVQAINGGVIAAGFDAVCVLAALGQYEAEVVVTLTLQVHYLRLARVAPGLVFRARVTKSARHVCFVQAELFDQAAPGQLLASASASLAPVGEQAVASAPPP